jgi:crossover junction endodeoxyribonuclease RuvC
MTAVMGCDPSLAGFAYSIAVENGNGLDEHEQLIKTKPSGDDVRARVERYRSIAEPTVAAARAHGVALFVIEGYSFGSAGGKVSGHAHDRAELGGILRNAMVDVCRVVEVAPTTLKKYATGKGNADKAEVISALSRRYGRTFKSDDAADAYALMQIGLCLSGVVAPETRAQAEVIAMLCGAPLPKLTKKQKAALEQGSLLA